ncbi:Ankyrin repeat-containing protein [Ruminococcaceae bacterium YRB3002]|nr:Ankyrin repeat-containing protein [Ruminococcaceae bacterium YRB3002]
MAFMGMFLAFMAVVIVVLGISALIVLICFLSSGLIMLGIRKKNKDSGNIKTPWYVITLRVIGCIAALPLIAAFGVVIYVLIASAVDKRTNLPRAVMSYDYEQAESILQNGADPDVRDKYGKTLLICMTNHDSFVSVDDDMRYDCRTSNYWNDEEDIKMMELLLKYGADINAGVTGCGDENNHVYEEGGWHDIYANSDHYCGNTPLIYAVRDRSAELVEFLIDNGADVNQSNACGFTPILMCADMRSDDNDGLEIAAMLMEEGADPKAVTNFHQDIYWLLSRQNTDENSRITALIESAL